MSKEQTAFEELNTACQNLLSSKLILSSTKITGVLNAIAANAVLKNTIADAMTDFDYERELLNSIYKFGNLVRFKLPPQTQKAVALVVNMLYDFDNGRLNFVEFVTSTFPEVRADDSYRSFGENVITPFIARAKELIFAEKIPTASAAEKIDAQTVLVNAAIKDRSEYITENLHKLIIESDMPNAAAAHFMTDGLIYTMELRDLRLIKIAFLGLKCMLKDYKRFAVPLAELEGIIRMYSVN